MKYKHQVHSKLMISEINDGMQQDEEWETAFVFQDGKGRGHNRYLILNGKHLDATKSMTEQEIIQYFKTNQSRSSSWSDMLPEEN